MIALSDWLPPALAGAVFTTLGLLKVYGLTRGIQGGGCKPAAQRACGSCPSWSRRLNVGMVVLVLVLGLSNLGYFGWLLFGAGQP